MYKDYIPRTDSGILEFANNFIAKINGNEAMYGLDASDTMALGSLRSAAQTSYNDNLAKQNAARTSREQKEADFKPLVTRLRELAGRVQVHPGMTDTLREGLGITIRDSSQTSVSVPQTRPIAQIDTSVPLRHTIEFYDNESATKGKPEGVKGAEIFCKIGGEATMNEDDYKYCGTDTASPYLMTRKTEDIGKQAHYILRWVNSKGESGAWSNPVSGTITG